MSADDPWHGANQNREGAKFWEWSVVIYIEWPRKGFTAKW